MRQPDSRLKVGILGGGQLARMLALQAFPLGLEPWVLSEHKDDPAAQVTSHWIEGRPDHGPDVEKLCAAVDVITFESEFCDMQLLQQIRRKTKRQIDPKPELVGQLQDRLSQKQLLRQHQIPTAPFVDLRSPEEALDALELFDGQMILKKRRFGYDGYGTFVIKSAHDLTQWQNSDVGFIAEPIVPFKRELAAMGARSRSGDMVFLPLVESRQVNSRCLWVKGPVQHPQWSQLERRLKSFLKKIDYVGVMGFELFETRQGLLINELAPRVHNTGHYSLEALSEDQFSLHLKCLSGEPLTAPTLLSRGFAMMNLLGQGATTPHWRLKPFVNLHWYGKNQGRPGRKMGHYTVLAKTANEALRLAQLARKDFHI